MAWYFFWIRLRTEVRMPQMRQNRDLMHQIRAGRCQCPSCLVIFCAFQHFGDGIRPPPLHLVHLCALSLPDPFQRLHFLQDQIQRKGETKFQ